MRFFEAPPFLRCCATDDRFEVGTGGASDIEDGSLQWEETPNTPVVKRLEPPRRRGAPPHPSLRVDDDLKPRTAATVVARAPLAREGHFIGVKSPSEECAIRPPTPPSAEIVKSYGSSGDGAGDALEAYAADAAGKKAVPPVSLPEDGLASPTPSDLPQQQGRFSRVRRLRSLGGAEGPLDPTEEEMDRGVYIDRVYELWDPSTRSVKIMNVGKEVIHRRPSKSITCSTSPASVDSDPQAVRRGALERSFERLPSKESKSSSKTSPKASPRGPRSPSNGERPSSRASSPSRAPSPIRERPSSTERQPSMERTSSQEQPRLSKDRPQRPSIERLQQRRPSTDSIPEQQPLQERKLSKERRPSKGSLLEQQQQPQQARKLSKERRPSKGSLLEQQQQQPQQARKLNKERRPSRDSPLEHQPQQQRMQGRPSDHTLQQQRTRRPSGDGPQNLLRSQSVDLHDKADDSDVEFAASVSSEPLARRSIFRRETLSNMEVVTEWAVLVGKMLHIRVQDVEHLRDVKAKMTQRDTKDGMRLMVLTSVKDRADKICKRMLMLATNVAKEKVDLFDCEWKRDGLLSHLFGTEYLDSLIILARAARRLIVAQPSLVQASSPCKVFGDIHGQLRDVLLLFHAFGAPGEASSPSFIFNGDFVDRGAHQLEVLGVLLALKLAHPDKVWLVRGNHEDRNMNQMYGFEEECAQRLGRFGEQIMEVVERTFDVMPIGCCIDEKILVVHGGIGRGKWTLSDLRSLRRPLSDEDLLKPANAWILDILWSDPIEDNVSEGVFGVHKSPRGGIASQFAWDVTKTFCARNGISLIIRSHQSKTDSVGFEVMHDNMVMRVFSARDYEGHGNDGAVLHIMPWSNSSGMLRVRPQVLRATTKQRRSVYQALPRTGDVGKSEIDKD